MEFLTGMLILGVTMGVGKVVLSALDENGEKQSLEFKGRYNRRELNAYRNQKVDIEFEWGNEGERKNLRLSLPSPTIRLG
jgi:hypothetical protein